MSQIPYNLPALLEAVDNRVNTPTPITNTYFSRTRLLDSCEVQMDIRNGPNGVMCSISKDAKSNPINKDLWQSILFSVHRFSEHCKVKPGDHAGRRVFGSESAKMLGIDQPREEGLRELLGRYDLTREFMSAGALCGEIKDGCGKTLLKLPIFDGGNVMLSDGSDDIFDVVFDAKVELDGVLADAGRIDIWFGVNAYKAFLASPSIAAIRERFPLEVLNGRLPNQIVEVSWQVLTHSYLKEDGTREFLLDPDAMIIVSRNLDGLMLHGPVETVDGLLQRETYLDEWVERDPPVRYMRFESNPLPFMRRPHGVRKYTVS